MLILSRKVGEKVQIGDDITVMLVAIKRGEKAVRLGIDAPKGTPITRDNAKNKGPRK